MDRQVAVIAVGRFQPPTIGHKAMIDEVIARAKKEKGDAFIFTTNTHGGKRYPLNVEERLALLRDMFPDPAIQIEPIQDAFKAAAYIQKMGYTKLIWFAGEDRVKNYEKILGGLSDIRGSVVRLERDPDSNDLATAISGTKMREWASSGNVNSFSKGLNASIRSKARSLMNQIKRATGGGGSRKTRKKRRRNL
jgi:hypothetical protein